MREVSRFTFFCLSMGLAAQLYSYTREWNLVSTGGVVLLGLTLSLIVVPSLRRNEFAKLFLVLLSMSLVFYSLLNKTHNPAVDTTDLVITLVVWRCYFEDEWPHWKRRLSWLTSSVRESLSRPVMPLPIFKN